MYGGSRSQSRNVRILSRLSPHSLSIISGALQDVDQTSIFKSLCKETIRVTRLRDLQDKVTEALCIAASGVPGPVFLELPVDLLYPYQLGRQFWLLERV